MDQRQRQGDDSADQDRDERKFYAEQQTPIEFVEVQPDEIVIESVGHWGPARILCSPAVNATNRMGSRSARRVGSTQKTRLCYPASALRGNLNLVLKFSGSQVRASAAATRNNRRKPCRRSRSGGRTWQRPKSC